jgi:hypothetical protein
MQFLAQASATYPAVTRVYHWDNIAIAAGCLLLLLLLLTLVVIALAANLRRVTGREK